MRRYIAAGLLSVIASTTLAAQHIPVKPGVAAKAKLSVDNMTHLYVKDDLITDVWTVSKNINIQQNNEAGELYITVKEPEDKETITLMALTEKGERINLVLTPEIKGADTIELKTAFSGTDTISTSSQARPGSEGTHEAKLVALIKAMHTNKSHSGFEIKKSKSKTRTESGLRYRSLNQYTSAFWRGETLTVTNTLKTDVYLSESLFSVQKPLAVGLPKTHLHPGEQVQVYVISEVGHG